SATIHLQIDRLCHVAEGAQRERSLIAPDLSSKLVTVHEHWLARIQRREKGKRIDFLDNDIAVSLKVRFVVPVCLPVHGLLTTASHHAHPVKDVFREGTLVRGAE